MASFSVYAVTRDTSPRRRPMLAIDDLRQGAELWLDGIDGFFDQFFECRTSGEQISFIALPPGDRSHLLRDIAAFEALMMVDARLVQVTGTDALARMERVQPLAQWMRTTTLGADDALTSVPENVRPDEAMLDCVRAERLVVSQPDQPWRPTLYHCRDEAGHERCAILVNWDWGYLVAVRGARTER